MANLAQLFSTAPRMKLYVDNLPVAFAIGFNINVSVDIADVYVIGSYAPMSQEPTMYNLVNGTMQIVPVLAQKTQQDLNVIANGKDEDQLTSFPAKRATTDFNAAGTSGQVVAESGTSNSVLQGTLARHLSPETVLLSKSFDIKVFMKVPNLSQDGNPIITASNPFGLKEVEWMIIRDCRISSDNVNISMGQLVNRPLNFSGLLLTPSTAGVDQFTLDGSVVQDEATGQ
jgi:hypothetical protein